MGVRRTQNADVVRTAQLEWSPWAVRCLRSSRRNSDRFSAMAGRGAPAWSIAGAQDEGTASGAEDNHESIRIRITTCAGSQSDGFVLAACGSIIRVAIPGSEDAEQFWCRDGHWFSEDGRSVEIEFFAAESYDYEFPRATMTTECLDSRFWGVPALAWVQ